MDVSSLVFFYVYKYIILLCISIKNALALNEMSKTAETEIPTFFFWLWPASAANMGTVRKNKLFTKIDAKMIKYYIVKSKVEYQFFVDHIIFEPYFFFVNNLFLYNTVFCKL